MLPQQVRGFDPGTENFFGIVEVHSGGGAIRHALNPILTY